MYSKIISVLILVSNVAVLVAAGSSSHVTFLTSTHSGSCSHSLGAISADLHFHLRGGGKARATLVNRDQGEAAATTTETGESGIQSCEIAHVLIEKANIKNSLGILEEATENPQVRKLVIKSEVTDVRLFGSVIDEFMAKQPWWVLKAERYNMNGGIAHAHEIVFIRYRALFENQLRLLAAVQYPPQHGGCDATPLVFGRMLNSGWGSMMSMFASKKESRKFYVFDIWYSRYNGLDESMAMIHKDDCVHPALPYSMIVQGKDKHPNANRWNCLFLPLTNCSTDELAFTHCVGGPELPDCFLGDFFQVCNATSKGGATMLPVDEPDSCRTKEEVAAAREMHHSVFDEPTNQYQRGIVERYKEHWKYSPGEDGEEEERNHRYHLVGPFINAKGIRKPFPQNTVAVFSAFALILRPNFFLRTSVRTRIAELIDSKSVPYDPVEVAATTGCVAIHIRRGDRMLPGEDMKKVCALYTLHGTMMRNDCKEEVVQRLRAEHHPHETVTCQRLLDMGCYNVRSFGEVMLTDYLQRAAMLSPVSKHAFVMTDDGPWLEQQIADLTSAPPALRGWSVGRLAAAPDSRIDLGAERNGTASSIDWWTSIELARHCHAFVGHFSSEVSHFVFQAMCYHYDKHTGQCPPGSDIGGEGGL